MTQLNTQRLVLREWRDDDFPVFHQLNADLKVMEFFPAVLSEAESLALFKEVRARFQQNTFGLWACELKANHEVIGFVGLNIPTDDLPFNPCVEIGWRLLPHDQKQGLAQEAAQAVLACGFNDFNLPEIVAFTTLSNLPSQALMQRLGMEKAPEYFHHPRLAGNHPLAEHVLYRLPKQVWLQNVHKDTALV